MSRIYTFGYTGRHFSDFMDRISRIGALVVDVRFSARSRDSVWNASGLSRALGSNYVHLHEFGNANYKRSGQILLANAEAGIERLESLAHARPVVLLCACDRRQSCHRAVVAAILTQRLDLHDAGELFAPRVGAIGGSQLELI
jgi:uncharacterized protein (DUF488 family)